MAEEKQTRTSSRVKLLKKLLEIRKGVSYLQKAKHEGAVQFSYVSSDQVLGAVREKMNELGVLLVPSVVGSRLTHFTTKNGSPQFMTEVDVIMTWVDVDTGEEYPVQYYGQGVDNSEKGVGKAATYLEKYFILKFFNVPTSDLDPDSFQEKISSEESKAAKRSALMDEIRSDGITLPRLNKIWADNKPLQKDAEFRAAVSEAGGKLKKSAAGGEKEVEGN